MTPDRLRLADRLRVAAVLLNGLLLVEMSLLLLTGPGLADKGGTVTIPITAYLAPVFSVCYLLKYTKSRAEPAR